MLCAASDWSDGSLTEIRIRHCSDQSLYYMAERCKNVEVISIRNCLHVTDSSIFAIAHRCQKLRELDISHCLNISHESLMVIGRNCPNLVTLNRNSTNWLDPFGYPMVVPNEYLRDGDSEAAAIANTMPHLRHLEFRFNKLSAKGLNSICQGCVNLETLDLYGCDNLTTRDIVNATSNLKHLIELKKSDFFFPRFSLQTFGVPTFELE